MPEKKFNDGTVGTAGLRELRLRSLEQRRTGPVIFITCDWDWGGREGGLIDLDDACAFRSFRLSW